MTDPAYYGNQKEFISYIQNIDSDFLVFRDKKSGEYKTYAKVLMRHCGCETKVLLHGDVALAKALGAYGVHLRSEQFDQIRVAKKNALFTVISTHSIAQAKRAKKLGADAVTYSPVFATPGKGRPKGIADLKYFIKAVKMDVIALGGITGQKQLAQLQPLDLFGFASIRYFAP
ncbi:MAG: thiamine phosphate synthase [Campylobacterota bacterium]